MVLIFGYLLIINSQIILYILYVPHKTLRYGHMSHFSRSQGIKENYFKVILDKISIRET